MEEKQKAFIVPDSMGCHLVSPSPPLIHQGVITVLMGQEVGGSDGAAVGVEEFGIISEDSLIVAATGKLGHGIVKGQVDNLNREIMLKRKPNLVRP